MTTIFLHGSLGAKYGKKFSFSISRPQDAVSAIETIHEGFSKDVIDLSSKGQHYSIIADDQTVGGVEDFVSKKKIKEVHILPTICGSGVVIGSFIVGALAVAGAAAASAAGYALLASVLVSVAVAAISFGIQALLTKPPKGNDISGSTSSTSATSKSFLFTNKENIKQQGNPVPLGYGRLRIGSSVIQETIKSYPNSISTFDEFVSQSTKEGQSLMSVVNNQET